MKHLRRLLGLVALAGIGTAVYLLFTGPDMTIQPNIREFNAVMPPSPAGAVAAEANPYEIPTTQRADAMFADLPATAENIARGKVYYGYYCLACHGEKGDGNGPVSESYVPSASDLRTAKIQAYSSGKLMRAMLLGAGHEPVLGYTVLPRHRPYIVLYVKSLGG